MCVCVCVCTLTHTQFTHKLAFNRQLIVSVNESNALQFAMLDLQHSLTRQDTIWSDNYIKVEIALAKWSIVDDADVAHSRCSTRKICMLMMPIAIITTSSLAKQPHSLDATHRHLHHHFYCLWVHHISAQNCFNTKKSFISLYWPTKWLALSNKAEHAIKTKFRFDYNSIALWCHSRLWIKWTSRQYWW